MPVVGDAVIYIPLHGRMAYGVGMEYHHAFVRHKKGCFADFGNAVIRFYGGALLLFFRFHEFAVYFAWLLEQMKIRHTQSNYLRI